MEGKDKKDGVQSDTRYAHNPRYCMILPDAEVKIFLTASSEARARRRWLELQRRGTPKEFDEILQETVRRDADDANRAVAPLRPAADAVTLDTTGLNFEESLERIIEIIRERIGL